MKNSVEKTAVMLDLTNKEKTPLSKKIIKARYSIFVWQQVN